MTDTLARLEPRALWAHFSALAAIPRPSKHEERVVAWVRSIAAEHGFEVRADGVGNLVLQVPATPGHERAAAVVLQSHLDMVCEKNADVTHDFMNDPIRPRIDGDWVYASGTTLGADNGIGVAAALAVATDPDVVHGPLELLFTIDEETGLTGAQGLDAKLVAGRTMLNLDSEEDGKLVVGCAGGADVHLHLARATLPPRNGVAAERLGVRGLRGGHSGLNIHENRGNALKLLARMLVALREARVDFELASIAGGSKHNAIPREAEATLLLAVADARRARDVVGRMVDAFRAELRGIDDGLEIGFRADGSPSAVFDPAARDRLIDLLAVLPHGVLAMSPAIPGLVETSSNLAVVEQDGDDVRVVTSSRSSVGASQEAVLASIRAAGRLAGAAIRVQDGYPGWNPDLGSPVLGVTREVFSRLWGREPEVTAVHAGLECGIVGEKIPGMDMISFGPQIEGAHSPDERVQISSTARFWDALVAVLAELA